MEWRGEQAQVVLGGGGPSILARSAPRYQIPVMLNSSISRFHYSLAFQELPEGKQEEPEDLETGKVKKTTMGEEEPDTGKRKSSPFPVYGLMRLMMPRVSNLTSSMRNLGRNIIIHTIAFTANLLTSLMGG